MRILMNEILATHPALGAIVVSESEGAVRVARRLRRRVRSWRVTSSDTYGAYIAAAVQQRPGLLVIDRLSGESLGPVFGAARSGLWVLTQLDMV